MVLNSELFSDKPPVACGALAGGSSRRDVSPAGWTQMMGIILRCGGGGVRKVLLVRLTAR